MSRGAQRFLKNRGWRAKNGEIILQSGDFAFAARFTFWSALRSAASLREANRTRTFSLNVWGEMNVTRCGATPSD
jgi:hypothetical protein